MRTGTVIVGIEQTLLIAAPNSPMLLSMEGAMGLSTVSRLPVYNVRVLRWAVERTIGAAAATFSPTLFDDGTTLLPFRSIDTMGTAIPVNRIIRTPPAAIIAQLPLGILAVLIAPNVGGDTFRVRAVLELLQ